MYFAVHVTLLCIVLFHNTWGKIDWPAGQYGLPKPQNGCPKDWVEGRRFQSNDTKTGNPSSHLAGKVNDQGIEQDFCMKTDSEGNGQWPTGKYCILKRNTCPVGLTDGYMILHKKGNKDIAKSHGEVNYCCSTSGKPETMINLPVDQPFYLYSYENGKCQQVNGATSKEETVIYNDQSQVVQQVNRGHRLLRLVYCYYSPVAMKSQEKPSATKGVVTQLTNGNEGVGKELVASVNKGSELDNKTQSSALAVAIGVGIAGAIVGIACVAIISRRLMKKKKVTEESEQQPQPDEP